MSHMDPSIDIDPVLDGDYLLLSRTIEEDVNQVWRQIHASTTHLLKCARYIIVLMQQSMTLAPLWRAWFVETWLAKALGCTTLVIAMLLALNTLHGLALKKDKTPLDRFIMGLLTAICGLIGASFYFQIVSAPLMKICVQSLIIFAQVIAITRLIINYHKAPDDSDLSMSYKQAIFSCLLNLTMSVAVITLTATFWFNPVFNIELASAGVLLLLSTIKLLALTLPREQVQSVKTFFGFGKASYQQGAESEPKLSSRFGFWSKPKAETADVEESPNGRLTVQSGVA